ncbi:MAG: HEAT repeat domain-containing protein [Coriobacteriia bacterium]|nr:HEAT repeat domain-containing protein [Coriobacteriia bacterium]
MRTRLCSAIVLGLLVASSILATGCDSGVYKAAEEGDVDALVAMAEDVTKDQYAIRQPAVEQLGELGTPEAVDALLGWAEGEAPLHLEGDVYAALGATGDPRAIEPLLTALAAIDRSKSEYDIGPVDQLKLWGIMRGLANLPDPKVAEALLAELDAGHAAAISEIELADALAGQGEAIVPALEQRLANGDEPVFVPAARALCDIYRATGNDARITELLANPATFRIYEGVLTTGGVVEPQVMIDSLNAMDDVRMAQRMLNSNVEEYEAAATAWAAENGYMISSWITP